jgi:hypothetical protein
LDSFQPNQVLRFGFSSEQRNLFTELGDSILVKWIPSEVLEIRKFGALVSLD